MEMSLPEGAGSSWLLSFLNSWLVILDHGPSLLLVGLMIVAGAIGTAGCPFTIPTMLGIAGTAGAEDAASGKRRGLWLGASFSGGMWLGMILLGAVAGSVSLMVGGEMRRMWSLAMVGLALFLGVWILRRESPGPTVFKSRTPATLPWAFFVGLIYSLGAPLISLMVLFGLGMPHMTPAYGALLGFSFGLGRSAPFILAGVASDRVLAAGCRINGISWVRYTSATLMFIVAGYYLWLAKVFPGQT
jgi:cytochrome c-type biogenesis protein